MVEVANNTKTALVANQVIPFTMATFDTNKKAYFDSTSNSIVITKTGKYEVNGSFIFEPTGAGVVTITAYANGVAIPYDLATFTTTASDVYTFTLPQKLINVIPSSSGNTVKITFVISADGTLTNALASVSYVE